jgi:hypothetical protein
LRPASGYIRGGDDVVFVDSGLLRTHVKLIGIGCPVGEWCDAAYSIDAAEEANGAEAVVTAQAECDGRVGQHRSIDGSVYVL